jgi:hypothetical protein
MKPMITHNEIGIEMTDTEQMVGVQLLNNDQLELYIESERKGVGAYVSFAPAHLIDFFKDVIKRYG